MAKSVDAEDVRIEANAIYTILFFRLEVILKADTSDSIFWSLHIQAP